MNSIMAFACLSSQTPLKKLLRTLRLHNLTLNELICGSDAGSLPPLSNYKYQTKPPSFLHSLSASLCVSSGFSPSLSLSFIKQGILKVIQG